jgi:hypothetical protein
MSMMRATGFLEERWEESSSRPFVMIKRLLAALIFVLISHTPAFSQVDVDSVHCPDTDPALAFWRTVREALLAGAANIGGAERLFAAIV